MFTTSGSERDLAPALEFDTPRKLAGTLSLLLQSHRASMADVMLARQALEPMVAKLAAEHITDEQLARLQETVDLMRRYTDTARTSSSGRTNASISSWPRRRAASSSGSSATH